MAASAFPAEFADLLSVRGRREVERPPQLDHEVPFIALSHAIDARRAASCLDVLEREMSEYLVPIVAPIPPESIWNQTRSAQERLPKTVRMRTAYLTRRRSRAWRRADAIGLVAMLGSASLRRFGEALCGRRLKPEPGRQVLCYGEGDAIGPHHDHHPDIPAARDGYLDIHLSFTTAAVRRQLLVYAPGGHFTRVVDVVTPGLVTAYRLPFWHYVTPLEAKRGRGGEARRWVALASFLFA
jgi:hypothetical protein